MGLATHYKTADLCVAGMYCDGCEFQGHSTIAYHQPSFFFEECMLARRSQRMTVNAIKNIYIGRHERLTQGRMEEFFQTDAYFADADVGFFTVERARAYGYDV
jgi:hypothetical protein